MNENVIPPGWVLPAGGTRLIPATARTETRRRLMNCPLDGWECTHLEDVEIAGRTHELHKCRNPRCGKTWSPVKIRNGKKEEAKTR